MDFNLPELTANETSQNDHSNLVNVTQSYLLLKKRICDTHEVIQQYNDKLKECEHLKTDLDATNKQAKKVACNYNSMLAKVIKLELQNTEYKKNIESLTTQVNDRQVKAAADQQHIQQLICKIKDVESQHNDKVMQYDLKKSSLEVRVKELEQELKNVKKSYDLKTKKMEEKKKVENKTPTKNKVKMKDVGSITTLTMDEIVQKQKVSDKCVMTDEFYNVKDNMYPIFCAKCEVLLEPTPLEKICEIMTESCPKLIEKISSPLKKVTLPPLISPGMNNERCKTENVTVLPETQPSHLQNRTVDPHFIPTNPLASHEQMTLSRTDYCNNFPQTSSLMNQNSYCIGSTPVNPLSLANMSTTSQNNHCDEASTLASSLLLISSLQKRIDTLEMKVKKKFNKKNSEQNSNLWQRTHQNPCCMHDINSSMQFNFMELFKRVTDFGDSKEKKQLNINKRRDKSSNKHKLSQLKSVKRLQNAPACTWEVETIVTKPEQSPVRQRPKKRKYRHSMLLSKTNVSTNKLGDLEASISDSDSNSCNDLFTSATLVKSDISVQSKDISRVETTNLECNNRSKTSTCSAQSTDTDELETVDRVRNSVESRKSLGGETDSGILSDSVESNKLIQLEGDLDSCIVSTDCKHARDEKSSMENTQAFTGSFRILRSQSKEKSPIKLIKTSRLTEEVVDSKVLKPNEQIEEIDLNGSVPQTKTTTSNNTNPTRKRKISELQDVKKCSRQGLLKKIRNLKKNCKVGNIRQSSSDLQEIENCESHVSYSLQGEKHFEKEVEDIKDDDYVPKKKPRIAHVPKSVTVEQNNYPPVKTYTVKDLTKRKVKPRDSIIDSAEANTTITIQSTEIPDRYSIDIDESVVTQTMVKGDSNVGSENKCSNRTNELKPNSSNSMHSNTTNVPENNNINEMSTIDIKPFSHSPDNDLENKNLSMVDMNSSRDSTNLTMSSLDDSFEGLMEFDELKTEATNEYKQIKQEYQNNSPHSKNAILEADNNTNKFDDESSKNGTDQSSKLSTLNAVLSNNLNPLPYQDNDNSSRNGSTTENDVYVCKRNVQEVVRNQSCDVNGSLVSSEDIHLMNVQDNDTNKITKVYATKLNSNAGSKLESQSLLARIRQFASTNKSSTTNCNNQSMNLLRISLITDKFVNKQLQRLVDCDWKVCAVHWDVIDKLKTTCTPCVIAKGIVDFFSSEEQSNKSLDNSHTPPAPLMTQTQQRIAALLIDLEKSNPMIFQLVQTGIEYKLFRLNQQIERSVVESLARMYTILARIKKDRGKVRIFCCDALYCLGVNAILVLYTVFTCWPETFPNNETNKELLPECMAHLIMTQQAVDYPKLKALKNLVSLFYKYPTGTISKDMLNKLLSALQEKSDAEIEAAIILLAKREGTAWTYKNIIRGALLPMIINNKLPSAYRSFCLLGNLMRVFPVGDKNNSVGEIVEQLCDLINSGEVSEEQQEGIISALLSLSRHKFDDVVQNVIKWTPTAPLHDRTTEQINGLLNQRPPDFWKGYLRTNKLFRGQNLSPKILILWDCGALLDYIYKRLIPKE
ncbi:PREDICTED: uncharacterized protein LOC107185277 [Dufourea novaeangliae]|uniref:uncharacterized protein LOC107185277 n=1 Tax=Dufourea novaeangliae TaxID=178035 RepID=UPI00076740EB|nr:PREDICTED: uncharacterized protein LOC107185277 [Dufourea novaeangliae]